MAAWGFTGTANDGFMSGNRMCGGAWTGGAATLTKFWLDFYGTPSGNVRLVVQHHPTVNDPSGADVIWQEEVTPGATGWQEFSVAGGPEIPSGGYLFIGVKLGLCKCKFENSTLGDFDTRYTMDGESTTVSNPWDDPSTNNTASGEQAIGMYIEYSAIVEATGRPAPWGIAYNDIQMSQSIVSIP
jgi:hypothetical protein